MRKYWQNIQDGVVVLDQVFPNWREDVREQIDELNLQDPDRCILGLGGDGYWSAGKDVLEKINGRRVPMDQDAMAELGFDLPEEERHSDEAIELYAELTREWKAYLCDA